MHFLGERVRAQGARKDDGQEDEERHEQRVHERVASAFCVRLYDYGLERESRLALHAQLALVRLEHLLDLREGDRRPQVAVGKHEREASGLARVARW